MQRFESSQHHLVPSNIAPELYMVIESEHALTAHIPLKADGSPMEGNPKGCTEGVPILLVGGPMVALRTGIICCKGEE
jgi:hypothetical protein